tara:strand:- start:3746 stop:5332 length:1587 start_codon:yes stop_codon:yes gene_type:complete
MSYPLNKEQILKEILQCGKDPVYFLNNYAKISHPMHGLIPFRTYDFQRELLRDFSDHRFNVILKARQLGISTITAGYVVWMMLFHRDKNVLVMATKFGVAANLVKKVKNIMRQLPDWLRISNISVDNRTSFELSNGSQIKASSTSGDAGRSEALSLLVIDEAAHVEGLDELWTGLYPTLSTGGRCIALSTPNGVGNWFHQTYIDAEQEANDFYPTKLPWDVHPDRDFEWFEKETRNMSRRQIAQELECNFNMSGETVIHSEDIEKIQASVITPHHRAGFDRNLWIWDEFDPEHSYLLVADVARGDGKDYSAFHVIDVTEMKQVVEYQGKVELDLYSTFMADVGRQYGNAMIVVENNNVGYSVLTKLEEMAYSNIYYSTKGTHEYLDNFAARSATNAVPGFTTSMKTRPLIVAKLEEFIRNQIVTIRSTRLLNELKTFVWNNGKPQAMRGYNDDLVMSLAIACWVRDTALVSNQRDLEYKKAMMGAMTTTKKILNTKISGMVGYDGTKYQNEVNQAQELMKSFPGLFKG